jgi:hypothetical protein
MMQEIGNWIASNKNQSIPIILSSAITIIIAVAGWAILYFVNLRQQKILLKNNAKMKIYEELSRLVANYNKQSIKLSVSLNRIDIVFFQMSYVDKNTDAVERNYKGIKIWQKNTELLGKEISTFSDAYLEVWDYITYWISAMPKLKNMNKELFWDRYGKLSKDLWEFQRYLQGLSQKEFYWEKWNKEDVKSELKKINEKVDDNSGFFDDLITDIHNILVGKIFGHYKKKRENFANLPVLYDILTSNGIKKIKNKSIK